jgi:hypothetical protein
VLIWSNYLGAFQPAFDAFAARLDATVTSLACSTYLGGSVSELARDVVIDGASAARTWRLTR